MVGKRGRSYNEKQKGSSELGRGEKGESKGKNESRGRKNPHLLVEVGDLD